MLEQERIRKLHALEKERDYLKWDIKSINPKMAMYARLTERLLKLDREIASLTYGQSIPGKIR